MNPTEITTEFNKMYNQINLKIQQCSGSYNTRLARYNLNGHIIYNKFQQICEKHNMNPIYKEKKYHECNSCKHFFNNISNIAIIIKQEDPNEPYIVTSIFNTVTHTKYDPIFNELRTWIESHEITDPFILSNKTQFNETGLEKTENGVLTHTHFFLDVKNLHEFYRTPRPTIRISEIKTNHDLLQRKYTKDILSALQTVIEIIQEGNLYRTDSNTIRRLTRIINYIEEQETLPTEYLKEAHRWYNSIRPMSNLSEEDDSLITYEIHLFNTALGTLILNIHEGMDIEKAVTNYEKTVAPENYQRPAPIITTQMIEQARKTLTEQDYIDSIYRRHANFDDIPIEQAYYINRNNTNNTTSEDIFTKLNKEAVHKPQQFKNIDAINMKYFLEKILPNTRNLELYADYKLRNNFVSIFAPVNKDSKPLFKWDNNMSWSYIGNLPDSRIKENVAKQGGKVNGVLRFSLQWNDEHTGKTICDLDAHCKEPNNHISYQNKKSLITDGELDIDIITPTPDIPAVENITYPNKETMTEGQYDFYINLFDGQTQYNGFRCEIEFDGKIYEYEYNKPLHDKQNVKIATVTLKDNKFTIQHHQPTIEQNKTIWNTKINTFIPVQLITKSPNIWKKTVGIPHLFIILQNCINNEQPQAWYNEYLTNTLHDQKKVMNVMATKAKITPSEEQLSGIGISTNTTLTFKADNKIYNVGITPKDLIRSR